MAHRTCAIATGSQGLPTYCPQRLSCTPRCRRSLLLPCRQLGVLHLTCAGSFSASPADEDPFKVLGCGRTADFKAVQRAYNKKRSEAKGDDVQLARIEAAYNKLFMGSLTSRLQGGMEVSKDIKFADKPKYFPWRPRAYRAEKKYTIVVSVILAAIAAWSFVSPGTSQQQPVVGVSIVGAIANIIKLNTIFPPPSGPGASDEEKAQGWRNIIRGILLACMATFLGCFVCYTLPDIAAAAADKVMPYWFYEFENSILAVGSAISNGIMCAYFR